LARQVDRDEEAFRVEVVLAGLVDHADLVVRGSFLVR
jgi:hypothetical protein